MHSRIRSLSGPLAATFRLALFVLALLLSPVLWYLNSPVGMDFVGPPFRYEDIRVVGPLLSTFLRLIIALYSWPLQVGSADPGVVLFGLYPVLAAQFAWRRRYREAMWLLFAPLLSSWFVFFLIRT